MSEVDIIIPTYNKCSRLALTLWALQKQTLPASSYEVIIVDDGSTDDTANMVQNFVPPNWRYFGHTHAGRAYSRNVGAQQATAPLLIFLDDDILVRPDFIESHLALYREDHTCILHGVLYDLPFLRFFADPQTGTLINNAKKLHSRSDLSHMRLTVGMLEEDFTAAIAVQRPRRSILEKAITRILDGWEGPVGSWLACVGANLAIPRSILNAVGGFDEAFGLTWGCEDLELGYRLWQQGYPIMRADTAIGYHLTHYREAALEEHQISHSYFYAKHHYPEIKHLQAFLEGQFPTLEAYAAAVATETEGTLPLF
jgi:GT2 family glycosyltransferase